VEYLSGPISMTTVPSSHLAADSKLPDFHTTPLEQIDYISVNQGKDAACKPISCAPFNDLHFRRALRYAIDRQVITQKILHGKEVPLCGLMPRGIASYNDARALQACAL
jgi:ABC-type oligopeptide transport system substrate-binding subunit